jgi:hypothetical protein
VFPIAQQPVHVVVVAFHAVFVFGFPNQLHKFSHPPPFSQLVAQILQKKENPS